MHFFQFDSTVVSRIVLLLAVIGGVHCGVPPLKVKGQEIGEVVSPPLLTNLKTRTDELSLSNLISRSTIEAEQFRRSLLDTKSGPGAGRLIARACIAFRDTNNIRSKRNPSQRKYDLSRFQSDQQSIYKSIVGTRELPDAEQFYDSFQGKWFGIWEQMKVDHHWGKYVALDPVLELDWAGQDFVRLLGYQYAWVGDGYGLNHIAASKDGLNKFLLGYVIHIRDQDPKNEVVRRPHVGVIDGTDRLIWISKSEVFFEEMIRGKTRPNDHYYITGFRYNILDGKLVAKKAFQVEYSRDADRRMPWRGFEINLQIELPTTANAEK